MPESPDFEQIALQILARESIENATSRLPMGAAIAEQLRLVWNARGAADASAVEARLATLTGWVTSEPYRQHLQEAIAALDR
jgi:hypothetical protein